MNEELIKIVSLVQSYAKNNLANINNKKYIEGERIPYASKFYDEEEVVSLIKSCLEFWLTQGHFYDEFEKKLSDFLNIKYTSFVNSG